MVEWAAWGVWVLGPGGAVGAGAAEADFHAHGFGHGGFGEEAGIGAGGVVGVGDLDMVGLVAGHHLVSGDAVGDGVHDRPLGGGGLPAAFRFFAGEFDDFGASEVHVELVIFDEDTGPDDFAGAGDAAEGAAAEREVHGGLAEAFGAFPSVDEVGGWGGATNEEDPDVVTGAAGAVVIAPTEVVQRIFDGLAEGVVDALGHEAVEAGAFVYFVEVGEGLVGVESAFAVA
ncbi:MAG: hypothetical protein RI897_1829 [Verrucomicrobiota bacterium]